VSALCERDEQLQIAIPTHGPDPHELVRGADVIVINSSAGKDSMAMLAYVAGVIAEAGATAPVVVLHNDLGTTDSGEPVEWPGVAELAREHAAQYGYRFEIRRRDLGGFWDQLLNERKKWPSSAARWCTSDQKTSQGIKLVTQLTTELRDELGITDRPIEVLYCLGIRKQESTARKKKKPVVVDESHSSRNRTITRWHPILEWSVKDVWDQIKVSGLRPHAAYSWGMGRLSCSLCVLASPEDLVLAARLRPALAADYARAEALLGHKFTFETSMTDIIAAGEGIAEADRR
jgi:3'-phosphoadenosine 5'-phosphosulfate sulfotransferase (PAPS reductase)/FAD synthetase